MKIINNAEIHKDAIIVNLKRLINQIYKLLPNREENIDWQTPLSTIIEEFLGMDQILINQHETLFPLLCKLKGLFELTEEEDFFLYRRTIFECLNLVQTLKTSIEGAEE